MMETLAQAGSILFFENLPAAGRIDVHCDDATLAHLLAITRETWSELGRVEPHWSVMTDARYVSAAMSSAREAEFYATGAVEANAWKRVLARNGLSLADTDRFLEIGCGLGRVAEHLTPVVERYVGVDVSAAHLSGARARAGQLGLANADFVLLDDLLAAGDRFDGIASYLVFQHNPPPVMLWLLGAVLGLLAPAGYALLQIPTWRFDGYRGHCTKVKFTYARTERTANADGANGYPANEVDGASNRPASKSAARVDGSNPEPRMTVSSLASSSIEKPGHSAILNVSSGIRWL